MRGAALSAGKRLVVRGPGGDLRDGALGVRRSKVNLADLFVCVRVCARARIFDRQRLVSAVTYVCVCVCVCACV